MRRSQIQTAWKLEVATSIIYNYLLHPYYNLAWLRSQVTCLFAGHYNSLEISDTDIEAPTPSGMTLCYNI